MSILRKVVDELVDDVSKEPLTYEMEYELDKEIDPVIFTHKYTVRVVQSFGTIKNTVLAKNFENSIQATEFIEEMKKIYGEGGSL